MSVRVKICGMKYEDNILSIAGLNPDYLGFIFFKQSPRYFNSKIPNIPYKVKKVGVFVNETKDIILKKIKEHNLDLLQLHGDETPNFCKEVKKESKIPIVKAFGIDDKFDFNLLEAYYENIFYFLFDTKGKSKGGNGISFNWLVLKKYKLDKPYFLSGGIGIDDFENLQLFFKQQYSKHCVAIDLNSKLENKIAVKDLEKTNQFINFARKLS